MFESLQRIDQELSFSDRVNAVPKTKPYAEAKQGKSVTRAQGNTGRKVVERFPSRPIAQNIKARAGVTTVEAGKPRGKPLYETFRLPAIKRPDPDATLVKSSSPISYSEESTSRTSSTTEEADMEDEDGEWIDVFSSIGYVCIPPQPYRTSKC